MQSQFSKISVSLRQLAKMIEEINHQQIFEFQKKLPEKTVLIPEKL